jgi:hypothetical protein
MKVLALEREVPKVTERETSAASQGRSFPCLGANPSRVHSGDLLSRRCACGCTDSRVRQFARKQKKRWPPYH